MDVPSDTIVAVVTPPGRGGVGIVRVSGPLASEIGRRLFASPRPGFTGLKPYRLHHGALTDASGRPLDDVLAAFMPGPGSYTGEDVLELSCHGSPAILRAAVAACQALGARQAMPGEFTKRAFLSGRMDLSQAQAVAELVAADTLAGASIALGRLEGLMARRVGGLRQALEALRVQVCLAVDFPEDEVECMPPERFLAALEEVMEAIRVLVAAFERARPLREGAMAVLAGPVNAGKSSLLNALVGRERAIVCDAPGTTRDFLEEQLDLDGLPVRLVDTAGLRATDDPVERQGVARCLELVAGCGAVVLVVDGAAPLVAGVLDGSDAPGAGREGDDVGASRVTGVADGAPASEGAVASTGGAAARGRSDQPPGFIRLGGLGGALVETGRVLAVVNKLDLPASPEGPVAALERLGVEWLSVSARTGEGLDALCSRLRERLLVGRGAAPESEPVPNARECALLRLALEELDALARDARAGVPPDLLGVRLETACARLAEITGEITAQGVLDAIFEGFCIGK